MRKDIKLSTINADISDRSSGRRVNATIAFTISYDAPDPERAQKVANELVTLYLNENVKVRQQSVAETTAFLTQEAERLAAQIQATEAKLADFKRRNVGRMPDSSAVNIQLAERTESELQRIERETSLLQDRKLSIEAQLALVKPNLAPASLIGRGRAGRSHACPPRTACARCRRSTRAPPRSMAPTTPTSAGCSGKSRRSRPRPARPARATRRNSSRSSKPTWPRPEGALRRRPSGRAAPAAVDRRARGAGQQGRRRRPRHRTGVPSPKPRRVRTIRPTSLLAAQLESTQRELKQLAATREDLRAKQRSYDSRLLQIPEVEREYRELTRDYENAQTRYREIRAKQMQAEGAVELEKDLKAERFSLGEPANLPHKPYSPDRPRIALLGLLASRGRRASGSPGCASCSIVRSRVRWSSRASPPLPILTPIPYIETDRERASKRRRAVAIMGLVALLFGAFLLGIHEFVKPLPALAESVANKIKVW